jgi:hypothetical protein
VPLTFADALGYLESFINYERQPLVPYTQEALDLTEFGGWRLTQAIAETRQDDLLLVAGSLYLVGDMKRLLPALPAPVAAEALTQVTG